jgi:hypothetical protein
MNSDAYCLARRNVQSLKGVQWKFPQAQRLSGGYPWELTTPSIEVILSVRSQLKNIVSFTTTVNDQSY